MKEIANALQEAKTLLEQIHSAYSDRQGDISIYPLRKVIKVVNEALAEPLRNCDVGSAEEQYEQFILFCRRNSFRGVCNDSCKFANVNRRLGWQKIGQARCFPFWSQMPYETIE
jgi:hypothetical protein